MQRSAGGGPTQLRAWSSSSTGSRKAERLSATTTRTAVRYPAAPGSSTTAADEAECATLQTMSAGVEVLERIQQRVLWLATRMIHEANHIRANPDHTKVGGHQASSASVVSI